MSAILFGLFIPTYLRVFSFPSTFACSRSFFTCPSNLISSPGFLFLFGFLKGIAILYKISFASAKISSFHSMMLPVRIFRNNLFTFSVSTVTFFSVGSCGIVI